MQTRSVKYIGGSFMSALWTAATLVVTVNDVAQRKSVIWYWPALSLMGFIVFCAFVYYGWLSEYRKAKGLEDKQPSALVTPMCEGYFAYLRIENTGENQASFGVQILQWQGIEKLASEIRGNYNARWLNSTGPTCELASDQSNRIRLIEAGGEFLNEKDHTDKNHHNVLLHSEFETQTGLVRLSNEIKVTVKIFSSPRLKEPVQRTYTLSLGMVDGKEVWTQFKELK